MKPKNFLLESLLLPFASKVDLPLLQIFDNSFQYSSFKHYKKKFEYLVDCSEWEKLVQKQKDVLEIRKLEKILFSNQEGEIFLMKKLLCKEKNIGVAILGGFFLSTSQEKVLLLDNKVEQLFSKVDAILFEVFDLLIEDLSVRHTLESLAERNFCSISKIRRSFEKNTGLSFKKFYFNLKMEYALLLRNHAHSLSDIALAVGYSHASGLHRAMTQYQIENAQPPF